jgi:tRNA 2-selenouridine synthase
MKTRQLSVSDYLNSLQNSGGILIDVRSPKEYDKGHIPGAVNLPLLSDEHRHIIGTIYKQSGREAAVLKGFELVGPLFHEIISKAKEIASGKPAFVYCWRGGMRSNITAWILSMAGFQVTLLQDGYKSFRHYIHTEIELPRRIIILGGKTGSGKTEVLKHLNGNDHCFIDLEGLANHKGSSYGALGQPPQPSQEHFENLLGFSLLDLPKEKILFLENESRQIGNINIPSGVFLQMRNAPVIEILVPVETRKKRILDEYGIFPIEALAERTERIGKRLGNNHLKDALIALSNNDLSTWIDIILVYYDKSYQHGNLIRNPETITFIETDLSDLEQLSNTIKQKATSIYQSIIHE